MSRKHPHRTATASDIVQIVGSLDESVIAQIIATAATAEEVKEAYAWLSTRDDFRRIAHEAAESRIGQVYRLLVAERRPQQA